jgi:CPA2 family monovalent cation:H+ antiporter-2
VRRAKLVCIAINDPAATRRCISLVRAFAPDVRIVVRAHYVQDLNQLFAEGASEIVAEEFESTIDLFSRVLRSFGIPDQAITHFAEVMRMEGYEFTREAGELPIDPWLAEVLQEVATEWIDVPEGAKGEHSILDLGIRSQTGASILAVRRAGVTTPNPPPDFAIRAGDSLLVLAPPTGLRELRELLAAID